MNELLDKEIYFGMPCNNESRFTIVETLLTYGADPCARLYLAPPRALPFAFFWSYMGIYADAYSQQPDAPKDLFTLALRNADYRMALMACKYIKAGTAKTTLGFHMLVAAHAGQVDICEELAAKGADQTLTFPYGWFGKNSTAAQMLNAESELCSVAPRPDR